MVLFYLTKKTVKWQGLVGYLQHSYICHVFGCFTIANGEVIYFQLDSVNKLSIGKFFTSRSMFCYAFLNILNIIIEI